MKLKKLYDYCGEKKNIVEESVTRFVIYKCNFDLCTCQEKKYYFVNYRNEFLSHSIGLGKSKSQRHV